MAQISASETGTLETGQKEVVRAQLGRIVESEFFRSSQRCCRFLEYSVQHLLAGRSQDDIKERIIGVEVFHRSPDYDTAQDNIVRVTANEVRKRLAQYYGRARVDENPVITLPAGSYIVALEWHTPATAKHQEFPISEPQLPKVAKTNTNTRSRFRFRSRNLFLFGAVAMLLAFFTALSYKRLRAEDVVHNVWSALLESDKPVLICIAQPLAYLPPSAATSDSASNRFVPLPDAFVGVGDAYALADITELLSARGKRWHLLAGNDTPSQELKSGPVILIGAFSNPWTLRLTENLRFTYDLDPKNIIRDRMQPERQWRLQNLTPDWQTSEDFAIVSRFQSPETGEPVIVVAGLTNFGTEAAGEFLTSSEMLASALRDAPKDWKRKNFQFVLHTKLIGKTPERPTVIAKYFW
jgi:hypothetical protein